MKYIGIVFFVLWFFNGSSQEKNEIPFISHLINKGLYKEAIYVIETDSGHYTKQQQDSLHFYHGWANYSLKNLEPSTQSLLQVGPKSIFFKQSMFFAGYNQIYLENFGKAKSILEKVNNNQEPYLSLLNIELAGISMLQADWQNAENQLKQVNIQNGVLFQQATNLSKILSEIKMHQPKSPALAGIMSAIIPGSGKIYAGQTGGGIASMIGTIGFGFITWENYHKSGIRNAKTIIFGSIFAFSYISNIYGSVISVKVNENDYKNNMRNQILFQLHIPLRNFFD